MSQTKERWEQLCEQASVEQDSEKLAKLIEEINKLLAEKQLRLEATPIEKHQAIDARPPQKV